MAPSVLTDEKTDDQNYDQNGSVEIGYTTGPQDKIAEIKKANGVKNKQKVVEVADDTTYGYKTSAPGGPKSKGAANIRTYSDDPSLKKFPRISRPVELMRTSYDVVVIGSGYGGGVAASRMARGKKSVCLLELGKEKWPGEYPYKLKDAMNELHVSGEFAPGRMTGAMVEGGDPTGLYHLVVGKGQNAFMANGLGGTSLLNANVFLEADERTLQLDEWPKELRDDKDALKPHYERARQVLQPNPYPKDWPELPKLNMLEKQAEALGLGDCFYRVPQTTRFVDGPNSTGVEMQASALTGMDCTGINDGSKGSTLVNYLSDAWNWGAELFCETEVRYVKKAPNGDGYHVYFAWHGNKRAKFRGAFYEDLMWVHAKECVFLGAGAIGTTEILLRSKERGLPMSNKVGTGMSGNGDILAFGYNNTSKVHSIGREYPSPERPIGPTITGVIDCRDNAVNVLDGFVIEEGAVPEALSQVFQAMLELMPGKIYTPGLTPLEQVRKTLARAGSRILGPYYRHGSIERTQTYLIMSHDSNQATLTLKKGKPVLQFEGVGRSAHVQHLNNVLAQATAATGGTFVNSPFYSLLGQQEITVHAIGGACMSRDGTGNEGVTSNTGEVFTGETDEVHDGLVVCDGALVPAALGVNPFATITALAERSVALVAEARGIEIDYDTKNGSIDLFGKPTKAEDIKHEEQGTEVEDECEIEDVAQWSVKAVQCMINDAKANKTEGIGFTEIMSGFIHMDLDEEPVEDFGVASSIAKSGCEAARFFLSVKSWNTDKMVSRGNHSALLTGTFTCSKLPGPLVVHRGGFQLFNNDPRTPDTKNLTYNFEMTDTKHNKYLFNGYKVVNPSVAFNPLKFWKATSTLYVTITRYSDNKVIGRGTLHIQPQDFGSEVVTLQPTGNTIIRKGFSTAQFLTYFVKQSAGLFFAPLNILQWPTATYNGFINSLRPTNTKEIIASDRVKTTMQYWKPLKQSADKKSYEEMSDEEENKAPTILFIPGAAVDHQIFALPTIEKNAVDYFREKGYRIYCVTHRVGKTMSASKGYTAFDARLDIVAALTYITKKHEKQQEGLEEKVYVIAHCAGSVALASGLLDGTIPAKLIKGITASNVFMNPMFARVNMIKASGPIGLNTVYNKLIGSWFNCSSSTNDSYIQQALNQALRFYPVGNTSELCNSVVCHRSSLVFGRLWSHKNLNSATHTQLAHFVGGTSMNSLGHLMHEGRSGYVTGNGPLYTNLVNPLNISRFRDIPIFFIQGTENAVYQPVNTDVSYTTLRDQNGPKNYGRQIFTGYGHLDCWMGDKAHKDIYPTVLYEVDKVMRPRK